mgnify:CR=1 FL=1
MRSRFIALLVVWAAAGCQLPVQLDGGDDAAEALDSAGPEAGRVAWQSRCIPGESDPACMDYPPRALTGEPPNRSSCAAMTTASGTLVTAMLETPLSVSEGGLRFELRGLLFDSSDGFVPATGCVVYVTEPLCTFGGSCGGVDPDCLLDGELLDGVVAGTVLCPRLRCGDLFSIAGHDGPGAPIEFRIDGC